MMEKIRRREKQTHNCDPETRNEGAILGTMECGKIILKRMLKKQDTQGVRLRTGFNRLGVRASDRL